MDISRAFHDGDFIMADPGAGQILRTSSRSMVQFPITTVVCEERTLPSPERAGLFVGVNLMAGDGKLTLIVLGGLDQAGSNQITFDDAGCVFFYSIQVASKIFKWRILSSTGVNLQ